MDKLIMYNAEMSNRIRFNFGDKQFERALISRVTPEMLTQFSNVLESDIVWTSIGLGFEDYIVEGDLADELEVAFVEWSRLNLIHE